MQLSIAEVKRRLPAGKEFTAEFLGKPLVIHGNTGTTQLAPPVRVTRRKVVKQGGTMASVLLDGSKQGRTSYLDWRFSTAREESGAIVLTNKELNPPEDFLKITLTP